MSSTPLWPYKINNGLITLFWDIDPNYLWSWWTFNVKQLQSTSRCADQSWQWRSRSQCVIMVYRCQCLQCNVRSICKITTQSWMGLRRFIFFTGPNVNVICVAFWCQKFSIHWWRSYHRDLSWVTDDLFDFQIGMFFCCIIVENRL